MARIYDPGRAAIYQRLGIPTVATVSWATDQALRRLLPVETRAEWIDPTGWWSWSSGPCPRRAGPAARWPSSTSPGGGGSWR